MNKSKDKEIIEYLCAKHNITQTELAKRTGKTKQYISNITNGSRNISKGLYDCLVKLFPNDIIESNFILPSEITGSTIKELREHYRLSKVELAQKLDVNRSLISLIEKGSRGVSKAIKNKLRLLYPSEDTCSLKIASYESTPKELINRADTKVITIDKSIKYIVIKIDD